MNHWFLILMATLLFGHYNRDNIFVCIFISDLNFSLIVKVFEEEALTWEEKLNRINALFDIWIDVQRRWVYLEGIFSGSADIKTLLPVETSRFQSIR